MCDAETVRSHYDEFGIGEWERLDTSAHARLVGHLHEHFLREHVGPGSKVLDAGCGAGRFAVHAARLGGIVTLLDLSETQIALAEAKFSELGLLEQATGFLVGDILDLSVFDNGTFDTTLCYGGALNYLFEKAELAVRELVRVTKPGGMVLVSVMSRWGVLRYAIGNPKLDPEGFFGRPDYWMIHQVAQTGDLGAHPDVKHPPRHFFDSAELGDLLEHAGLEDLKLATAPSLSSALYSRLDRIEGHTTAWDVIRELEERAYCLPGMQDAGEHLLARGRVPKRGRPCAY
jgi:SAM-dependent methyltransferase